MLSEEQLAFYRENGYLLVERVLSPGEAATYRKEAHSLIERLSKRESVEATWGSAREMAMHREPTQLLHCHNVQFQSATFTSLLVDERLTGVAAAIIGSPNVQLHHNKLVIKPPEKGSPFPMHQDHPFFPHDRHSMIAAILHFDDAPLEKGCVRVVPGSHKLGPLEH
ncbi:MAG: phytanoyl-CoA dioxygenase family protein, partial [Candidatus Binatia bacterium]